MPARVDEAEEKAAKRAKERGWLVLRDSKRPGEPAVAVLLFEEVTDADMKELTALKNLGSLSLKATKVTDAGTEELKKALPRCVVER